METSESLRTGRLSVVLPAYNEEEIGRAHV